MVDLADSLVCVYVEMFTAFFVPCWCQSLDTYKLASYIHSYHLPFGELRNWQYSHSVALSSHRTGEILSSLSLDSNTSSVLKTCVSPVPTDEESLKSCADEFPAICITWPILARIIRAVARIVERSSCSTYGNGMHSRLMCFASIVHAASGRCGKNVWVWFSDGDVEQYETKEDTRNAEFTWYTRRMMKSLLHWMQNKERVEATNDDMPEEEELCKLRLDYKGMPEEAIEEELYKPD